VAKSYLSSSSQKSGAAAAAAESRKRTKYADTPSQFTFCPFAVETFGPFGDDAMNLVKELGRRLQSTSGETRASSFLIQRISLAIQRGNAASIFSTIPSSAKLNEIYYI
jgi:hypothetical protein